MVTAPDASGSSHQTAHEERLRQTIKDVQEALGSLPEGYNEPDAHRLIKTLEHCEAFVAQCLDNLHRVEQEQARREYHEVCTALSTAIRHAVGHPGRFEHMQRVAELARKLKSSTRSLRAAFGW